MTNTQSTLRTAAISVVIGAFAAGLVVLATRRSGPPKTRKFAASSHPSDWTVADVVAWARDGPAAVPDDVAKTLQREDIDGAALLQLDDAMLQSIGVAKMGARLRLVQAIAALRAAPTPAVAAPAAAISPAASAVAARAAPTTSAAAAAATAADEELDTARDAISEMVSQFRFISSPDFLTLPQPQQLQILNSAEVAFRGSVAAMASTPPAQRAELEPLVGRFGQLLTVLRARLVQQDGAASGADAAPAPASAPQSSSKDGPGPREAALAQKLEALIDVVQSPELRDASGEALLSVLQRLANHLSALRDEVAQLPQVRQAPYGKVLDQVEGILVRMVREGTTAARAAGGAPPATTAAATSTRRDAQVFAAPTGAGAGAVAKDVAARVQQVLASLQSRDLLSMASAQRRQMLEGAASELRAIVNEADLESLPTEAQEVVSSMIGQVASYVAKLREVSEAIDSSSTEAAAAPTPKASPKAGGTPSRAAANGTNGTSVLGRLRSQLDVMRNVIESDGFARAPETEQVAVARKIMEQLSELRELASGVLPPAEAEQFTTEIAQFLQILRAAIGGAGKKPATAAAAEAETAAARKSVSVLQRTQRLFDIIKSPQFEQAPDTRRATACSAIIAECDDLLRETATLPAREQTEVRGVITSLRRMVATMLPGAEADNGDEDEEQQQEEEGEEELFEEVEEEDDDDVDAEVDGGAHRFTGADSEEETEEDEEPLPPLAPPTPPGSDLEQELHRAARTLQSDEVLSPDTLATVASDMDRAIRNNRSEWQEDARLNQFVRQVMALLQRRAQGLQRPGAAVSRAMGGDDAEGAEGAEDEDEESIAAQLNEAAATLEALPALESPADLAPYMAMLEHCRAAQAGFTLNEARAYNRMQRAVLAAAQKLRGVDDEASQERGSSGSRQGSSKRAASIPQQQEADLDE